jgi:glutamate racemase
VFTSGAGISVAMRGALQEKGLPVVAIEDMPLLAG